MIGEAKIASVTEDSKLKDEVKYWKMIGSETKNSILADMADMADLNSKCDLMPNDVWIKLSDETKRMYYMEVLEIERVQKNSMPYKSSILNFISGHDEVHENIGEAVSSLGLICALLLGIPFSLMSIVNGEFYQSLQGLSLN
jgi:hypothetical protein